MANLNKYTDVISHCVDLVGGKDNISQFLYCTTRLRFNVKDKGLVKTDALGKLKGCLGTQWTGNQLQLIIGQDVAEVYKAVCKTYGISSEAKVDENLDANLAETAGEKPRIWERISVQGFFTAMSACIVPVIPMLVAGGMVKSILLILSQLGILATDSGTYVTLMWMCDASTYFLPVALGYTCAKRFNMDPSMGIYLGAILISPTLISMVAEGDAGSIFGLAIPAQSYTSSIFPVFLTILVASYIWRFLNRYIPTAVRSMFAPILTLVIMAPISLCVTAPFGSLLGSYLGIAIKWLYDMFGPLGTAIYTAVSPFLVMTGMHACLSVYSTNAIATTGRDIFVGAASFIRNLNQGIAALVVALKSKDPDQRATAWSCAITAIVSGVTEPALFGVNLRYRKPIYAACIGGFFGGLYAGMMGVARYVYGGIGLFGLTVFVGDDPSNLINQIIAMAIGAAVTFVVGWIIVKPEDLQTSNE